MTQDTFRLGALHIDETVAYRESEATAQQRTQAVRSTVAGIDENMPFHSEALEDALPSDERNGEVRCVMERRQQLQELLTASSLYVMCCVMFHRAAAALWQQLNSNKVGQLNRAAMPRRVWQLYLLSGWM